MLYIIIIILICVCSFLIYSLAQKKQIDKEIEKQNEILRQQNTQLVSNKNELNNSINYLNNEIDNLNITKQNVFNEINQQTEYLNKLKTNNEEIADEACANYVKTLETRYYEAEAEFDKEIAFLTKDVTNLQKELDKLKETRAAAYEALLKEQEVKDNKDNYKLSPSESDLSDARRLETVKRQLNKPRILSMLIWQTYWQPLAKKQFPIILQGKTRCGIYKITNLITNECYIGQAVDIYKRWNEHCKCGLGIDTPPGNKLYKAIQEYGLENFTFELLTECSQTELNEKEKYFIELYQANVFGYNGNKGVTSK